MGRLILNLRDPSLWSTLKQRDLPSLIWVTPTDTVYGLSTSLANAEGIERINRLKHSEQPYIVLVRDVEQARNLAEITQAQQRILEQNWPGPVSFVLPTSNGTIAQRLPILRREK